jgi:hypothetical protein
MKSRTSSREEIESGLLEKLLAIKAGSPDEVPPNHKTREEIQRAMKCEKSTAQVIIRKAIAQGILGVAMHKIRVGKVMRPTEHYFEI